MVNKGIIYNIVPVSDCDSSLTGLMFMKEGKFIAVEGIDGCGKTSLIQSYVSDHLGAPIKAIGQPSYNGYGGQIREAAVRGVRLQNEYDLFLRDRHDIMCDVRIANACGVHVISDRHYLSTAAYQSFSGERSVERIIEENESMFGMPDLTIILDLDPEVSIDRMKQRGALDVFDADRALLEHCAKVYKDYIDSDRVVHLDASGEFEYVLKELFTPILDKVLFS